MGTTLSGTTILVNDTDADLDPLTAIQVTGPSNASAFTFNSDGTFSYTPNNGFSGQDTFTYKANDGTADSNVATVTITVVNNAPTALTLSNRFIQEERPVGWPIGILTGTDTDLTDSLTYSLANTVSCDGADNGYFQVSGGTLQSSATPIDYQTKYFLNICVRVTDLGGLTFDLPVTVVVRSLHHFPMDVNGDGTDDYVTFRPSTGTWHLRSNPPIVTFGQNGDLPVGADYNGDGKSDIAVFRPGATGTWHIRGQAPVINFGTAGDVPLPVDYNGDGKADLMVFRPSTGTWHVRNYLLTMAFGTAGDIPVPADYNGDGKADIAVFRPGVTGTWHVFGQAPIRNFGTIGDIPVPFDYNSDGKADFAVYRPSTGTWHIYNIGVVTHGGFYDQPFPMFMNGAVRYMVIHAGPVAIEWQGFGMPTITFGANDDAHQ
jgi:VCBS repeat-containing protein